MRGRIRRFVVVLVLGAALLLSCIPAYAASEYEFGETSDEIIAMQQRLAMLGYFDDLCDGYYGLATMTAIENFQTANGLEATGVADAATVKAIKGDAAVSKREYLTPSEASSAADLALDVGASGAEVLAVNKGLNKLGFLSDRAGNAYDENTKRAVCAFQKANALPVTGIVDSATLDKLHSVTAVSKADYDSAQVLTQLQQGDTGLLVKRVQKYLQQTGYFSGECTGTFGSVTKTAVYAFQAANALEPTGVVDTETMALILDGTGLTRTQAETNNKVKEVKNGDRDDEVRTVATQLTELGYYTSEITTTFGGALEEAVREFQNANGLMVTGVADTFTRLLLNNGRGLSKADYMAAQAVAEVSMGASGDAVILLQERLSALGYYAGKISGTFDAETRKAVVYFQRGHELDETGIADHYTRVRMNRDDALTYEAAEAAYQARQTSTVRSQNVETLVDTALDQLEKPYEFGSSGTESFDCAGLIQYLYAQIGIQLPNDTAALAELSGTLIASVSSLQSGDLVCFLQGERVVFGVYIGGGEVIYASVTREKVVMEQIRSEDFDGAFSYAKRLF